MRQMDANASTAIANKPALPVGDFMLPTLSDFWDLSESS